MKRVLLIVLLPLLLLFLGGVRLLPAFDAPGAATYELAFEEAEPTDQEAGEDEDGRGECEGLFPVFLSATSFSGTANFLCISGVDLCRDPYLPYRTPPPDRC
ncbi:hypothetical protein V9K67_25410 [Paraflavisolibacter sp. H34]|uniref:hypothetical protein n=1 Tax=Huijunlia imazamoxiresistens TaxID=3127457 RepID=UPI0030194CAA